MSAFYFDKFWPILLGTSIQSFSQTFLLTSQNLVINQWFPIDEVGAAGSVVTMAIPLGSVAGMAITGYLFDDKTDIKAQIKSLFFYANILVTLIFMTFVLTFKDKPDHPPSAAAT
jgi:sugar phosphate permease